MPELPDFKALAYRVAVLNCEAQSLLDEELRQHPDALDDTINELKALWNALGAADKHAVDVEAHRVYHEALRTGRDDLTIDLVAALNALDR